MAGAVVGEHCNIGDHAFVESGARIGDRVTVKNGVLIWDGVKIENDVFIGPCVIFTNDRSPRSPRAAGVPAIGRRYEHRSAWLTETFIEHGASLGAGAVILSGITVGSYAMVGAGSVVTHNIPAHALVAGSPARPIGWACRCGTKLDQTSDGAWSCRHCGDLYSRNAMGLTRTR